MMTVQNFTYHCHTNFSDGSDNIEDMAKKAKELGFEHFGLTDHLIVHKDMQQSLSYTRIKDRSCSYIFHNSFAKVLPMYQQHCENIRKVAKSENIKIFVGFEVDYFIYDGWKEEFCDFVSKLDYDYLINGNHMLFDEKGLNLIDIYDLKNFYDNQDIYKTFLSTHFKTMKKAADSKMFKFIAHIDYARKLGDDVCGPKMYWQEKTDLLDSLQKNNVGTEISTKGLVKINDFYPSSEILDEIAKRNISVVISDDAHKTSELGRNFAFAEETLAKHNITKRIKF